MDDLEHLLAAPYAELSVVLDAEDGATEEGEPCFLCLVAPPIAPYKIQHIGEHACTASVCTGCLVRWMISRAAPPWSHSLPGAGSAYNGLDFRTEPCPLCRRPCRWPSHWDVVIADPGSRGHRYRCDGCGWSGSASVGIQEHRYCPRRLLAAVWRDHVWDDIRIRCTHYCKRPVLVLYNRPIPHVAGCLFWHVFDHATRDVRLLPPSDRDVLQRAVRPTLDAWFAEYHRRRPTMMDSDHVWERLSDRSGYVPEIWAAWCVGYRPTLLHEHRGTGLGDPACPGCRRRPGLSGSNPHRLSLSEFGGRRCLHDRDLHWLIGIRHVMNDGQHLPLAAPAQALLAHWLAPEQQPHPPGNIVVLWADLVDVLGVETVTQALAAHPAAYAACLGAAAVGGPTRDSAVLWQGAGSAVWERVSLTAAASMALRGVRWPGDDDLCRQRALSALAANPTDTDPLVFEWAVEAALTDRSAEGLLHLVRAAPPAWATASAPALCHLMWAIQCTAARRVVDGPLLALWTAVAPAVLAWVAEDSPGATLLLDAWNDDEEAYWRWGLGLHPATVAAAVEHHHRPWGGGPVCEPMLDPTGLRSLGYWACLDVGWFPGHTGHMYDLHSADMSMRVIGRMRAQTIAGVLLADRPWRTGSLDTTDLRLRLIAHFLADVDLLPEEMRQMLVPALSDVVERLTPPAANLRSKRIRAEAF